MTVGREAAAPRRHVTTAAPRAPRQGGVALGGGASQGRARRGRCGSCARGRVRAPAGPRRPRSPRDAPAALSALLSLSLSRPPSFTEMPSATNSTMASSTTGSSTGKAGPGSEAAPAAAAPQAAAGVNITTVQTEAMKQILGVIDKKLRNLEKKKVIPTSPRTPLPNPGAHPPRPPPSAAPAPEPVRPVSLPLPCAGPSAEPSRIVPGVAPRGRLLEGSRRASAAPPVCPLPLPGFSCLIPGRSPVAPGPGPVIPRLAEQSPEGSRLPTPPSSPLPGAPSAAPLASPSPSFRLLFPAAGPFPAAPSREAAPHIPARRGGRSAPGARGAGGQRLRCPRCRAHGRGAVTWRRPGLPGGAHCAARTKPGPPHPAPVSPLAFHRPKLNSLGA